MEEIFDFIKRIPEVLEESRVIVFLVDGLGSFDLRVTGFEKKTYRTVFPTSTPTFLYTFHSLLRPEEHGFLEWYMRFRNTIVAVPPWEDVVKGRELELGRDVDRGEVFPFKSVSEVLSGKGFRVLYYTPFAKSTFTKATSVGAEVREIKYLSQVFPLGEADFTLIYWPSIDSILHERYVDEAFQAEAEFLELFIRQLSRKIPRGTTLYVLTDHGLTLCRNRYELPTVGPEPPVGGERVAFYKGVSADEVREELSTKGIPAKVLRIEEIPQFKGRLNTRCIVNYGDVVAIAEEHACFRYPFERECMRGLGAHGGLSREEILINLWKYTKK